MASALHPNRRSISRTLDVRYDSRQRILYPSRKEHNFRRCPLPLCTAGRTSALCDRRTQKTLNTIIHPKNNEQETTDTPLYARSRRKHTSATVAGCSGRSPSRHQMVVGWEALSNEKNLTYNLEEYARAGMGAVEITPIYGVQAMTPTIFSSFLPAGWKSSNTHRRKENAPASRSI